MFTGRDIAGQAIGALLALIVAGLIWLVAWLLGL